MDTQEINQLFEKGTNHFDNRNYKEAARILKQAAQKAEGLRNNGNPMSKRKEIEDFILEIWDWCADALQHDRQYQEASTCNKRTLATRLGLSDYGPRHPQTLSNRVQLISNYSSLGQHDKAIAECREVLKIRDDTSDRNRLAQELYLKNDDVSVKEAININVYTLLRDENRHGRNNISVCQARYNLGVELGKLGKVDEAIDYLQSNVQILKENPRLKPPGLHAKLLANSENSLARCVERKEKRMREEQERLRREREAEYLRKQEDEEYLRKQREEEQLRKQREEELLIKLLEVQVAQKLQRDEKKLRKLKEAEEMRKMEEEEALKKKRQEEDLKNRRDEEKRRQEEKQRQAEKRKQEEKKRDEEKAQRENLLRKIRDARDRRDRRVHSGALLGISPTRPLLRIAPGLENGDDLGPLAKLLLDFEREIGEWNLLLKAAEKSKSASSAEAKQPTSNHISEVVDPSKSAPDLNLPPQETGHSSKHRRTASSSSVVTPTITVGSQDRPAQQGSLAATVTIHNPGKQIVNSTGESSQAKHNDENAVKPPRRFRSNETLVSGTTDMLSPVRPIGRSSSVRGTKRPNSVSVTRYNTVTDSARASADVWFEHLDETAHAFLSEYKDYRFEDTSRTGSTKAKPYNQVKIAILDTGAAGSSRDNTPSTIRNSKSRIVWRKFQGGDLPPADDEAGHGTQVASILLKVTPYAKIYVYRVVRSLHESIQPKIVAAALQDAITLGVDIINMSFGWDHQFGEGHDELRAALQKCHESGVLVFAATSNDGLESLTGMAYPARADGVIAIDAATAHGEWLPSNPSRDNQYKTHRFTAPGEAIKTDFPPQHEDGEHLGRMTGTSAATPIAAGIAALVLEFARQPPLGYAPEIARVLKRPDVMRQVLAGAVAKKGNIYDRYDHLVPSKLFQVDQSTESAGSWESRNTYREAAVHSVLTIIKDLYGPSIAQPMYQRLQIRS